jgi:GNAT superfamily N-acetyltransferase
MIHEATPADRDEVTARLSARIDMAMFPLGNLSAHGLGQGAFPEDHPQASRFWLVGAQGVVGLSQSGMLMPLATEGTDLAPLRAALAGQAIDGAVGPTSAVRPLLAALGLARLPTRKDADEPAFALALADLSLPAAPGAELVPAGPDHLSLLRNWRAGYHREILGTPPDQADRLALQDVRGMIARGQHRILMQDGQPVALTGFNASLPGIVQVGGVYTPPGLRGRGHARRAVALHLAEARGQGTTRAVLFAASPAAARAYQAIGFRPSGSFALVLLQTPVTMAP